MICDLPPQGITLVRTTSILKLQELWILSWYFKGKGDLHSVNRGMRAKLHESNCTYSRKDHVPDTHLGIFQKCTVTLITWIIFYCPAIFHCGGNTALELGKRSLGILHRVCFSR